MWHRNRFIGVLCRGNKEYVVQHFTATYKSRHRADLHGNYTDKFTMIENTYSFYLLDWRHTLRQNKPS